MTAPDARTTTAARRRWVTVQVPATSANLGPGFDSFGLALAVYDRIRVRRADGDLAIEVRGVGAAGEDEVPRTADHLVVRAMRRVADFAGVPLPAVHLCCENVIPHGGGLGSSAAAIVAGLLAGRAMLGLEPGVSDTDLLALGTLMEGHPDNVAPALLGGFTLAVPGPDGRPVVVRREVHPAVRAVVFSAHESSSTHHARGLLPPQIPHADAAANAATAALLVHALTEDPELLLMATVDRLHQQYRAAAMPATAALVDDLRAAGIAAVVSGAGPSVLALVTELPDLDRWQRPGFAVAEVGVSRLGAGVGFEDDPDVRPAAPAEVAG